MIGQRLPGVNIDAIHERATDGVGVAEIQGILWLVDYPGYTFEAGGTDRYWIRASFRQPCSATGKPQFQHTRKWYVSKFACKSEIVQTALKCVLTSVEHEAREAFKYRGRAVFGPHFDVDALHDVCVAKRLDYRK